MRVLTILMLLLPAAAFADSNGPARVVDGVTLEVGGKRIRLFGIDAPARYEVCRINSLEWRCDTESKRALQQLTRGKFIYCRERSHDRSGLVVAVCFDGQSDLNRAMVLRGMAMAFRRSSTDYVEAERAARAAGRGVWGPEYVEPWHPNQPQQFR